MDEWAIDSDLRAYRYVPPNARAVVLLLHGFGEHAGRYAATAQVFARNGIAVYAYDHRGHGRSPGPRALVTSFADSVDESIAMRRRVAQAHPGIPLVVMGSSMGGLMAIRSVQRDPAGLAGVVLVAPALAIGATASPFERILGAVLAQILPTAPIAQLELAALSRDRDVVAAFAADPLNHHGKMPVRTAMEMIAAGAAAQAQAVDWQLPTYIVHGDADRIVPATGSQRFAAAASGADVTLRLVPGGFHEPLSEPGGAALLDAVAAWILDRTPRALEAPASGAAAGEEPRRVYRWWSGLAFGAAINVTARLLGTNTGRYEALRRPPFAPPGWAFPVMWGINSALAISGNLRVLNGAPSSDRTAYLRLWAATWLLYTLFGYAFFRRKSPVLGLLVTTNFLTLAVLSAGRAIRIDRRLWITYATLLPWLVLATAVAGAVALENPDPLLDPPEPPQS